LEDLQDIESRAIQFTNLDPQTTTKDILEMLKAYGEIESVDLSNIIAGTAIVRFYDVRVSQAVRRTRFCFRNRCLGVTYGPPLEISNPRKPPNNGTIVVFHLRKGIPEDGIHKEFAPFGAIRQIRCAPGKLTQRFIEYYDVRAAQAAVTGMKGKKIFKSKISVEFSLPGGFKKTQDQVVSPRLPTIERASRSHTAFAISY
jgi:RNA recognition motif-containing protein